MKTIKHSDTPAFSTKTIRESLARKSKQLANVEKTTNQELVASIVSMGDNSGKLVFRKK